MVLETFIAQKREYFRFHHNSPYTHIKHHFPLDSATNNSLVLVLCSNL